MSNPQTGGTVGDDYPVQQARVRRLVGYYKELGPPGAWGAAIMEDLLKRADEAALGDDIVLLLRIYQEMKEAE